MKISSSIAIIILLFITACNSTFEVGIEHAPAETIPLSANPTEVLVQPIAIAPTTTIEPLPSTTIPVATDVQPTQAVSLVHMVNIFMVAVDDKGQSGLPIGCGDSIVPVQIEIPPTQGVLKAALDALLSNKAQYYGQSGLYNALYQSDLQLDRVSVDSNGKASVYLTGTLIMGGECDTPRVQAQLEQTVLQFPSVTGVDIFINGKPIADALSLKG